MHSPESNRRLPRGKEHQFIYRHGSKLHAYDRDKAPYPCSFDRDVVELYVLITPYPLASYPDITMTQGNAWIML